MLRGIYTGASGMVSQMHNMDATANNLANVDLTGYKNDTSVHKAFPELLMKRLNDDGVFTFPFGSVDQPAVIGKLGTGVEYNETYTAFEQGALKQTENPFDLAIDGEGFIAVQTPQGERYTRNGSFHLSPEGILVTKQGFPVLGENGIIQLKKNNFVVDKQGRIFQNADFSDNPERLVSLEENEWENIELLDTLKVRTFTRPRYLKKMGDSMWNANNESGEGIQAPLGSSTKIEQGFLEASNVNIVKEMVRMIEINRAYEANQKTVQTQDSLTDKLINDMVRL